MTSVFITAGDDKIFLPKFSINTVDINMTAYNIARNYNLSLYKTVFVDEYGNIKFNITDTLSYGNITNSFEEITRKTIPELAKVWNIKRSILPPVISVNSDYAVQWFRFLSKPRMATL